MSSNEMPHIDCGCGFTVVGTDEAHNRWAFEEHECSLNPRQPVRWYEAVFSFWGFAIALVIAITAAQILTGGGLK